MQPYALQDKNSYYLRSIFWLPGYAESIINEPSQCPGGASERALFIRQKGVPICADLRLSHSNGKFIKSCQQIRLSSSPNPLSVRWLKVSLVYQNEKLTVTWLNRNFQASCHVTLQKKDWGKKKERLSQEGQTQVHAEAERTVVIHVSPCPCELLVKMGIPLGCAVWTPGEGSPQPGALTDLVPLPACFEWLFWNTAY